MYKPDGFLRTPYHIFIATFVLHHCVSWQIKEEVTLTICTTAKDYEKAAIILLLLLISPNDLHENFAIKFRI